MKSRSELEFRAGVLLGEMLNAGLSPKDAIAMLVLLVAYMFERQSTDVKAARDHFVSSLDEVLAEGNN